MKIVLILLLFAATIAGCKKESQSASKCYPDSQTLWKVEKAAGIIIRSGERFYITQVGTIDTRFVPCDLPANFQIDKLNVIFSGDVKVTKSNAAEPCCTNDIALTYISK